MKTNVELKHILTLLQQFAEIKQIKMCNNGTIHGNLRLLYFNNVKPLHIRISNHYTCNKGECLHFVKPIDSDNTSIILEKKGKTMYSQDFNIENVFFRQIVVRALSIFYNKKLGISWR